MYMLPGEKEVKKRHWRWIGNTSRKSLTKDPEWKTKEYNASKIGGRHEKDE